MAQQRILVTGAAGNLGQDLVARLKLFQQYDTIGTTRDRLDLAWEGDEIRLVLDQIQPDVIINSAAFTGVDVAESQFDLALKINGAAPRAMAEWTRDNERYMVQISTDYVFDGTKGAPYTPADPVHPIGRYGESKLAGEEAVLSILPDAGVVVRTSWLFGAAAKNFVPFVINAALEQEPIRVADDQWGTPTWTGNLSKMLMDVLENRPNGVLHGCSTGKTTRYDQALFICEAMGASSGFITPVPTEAFKFPAAWPMVSIMETSFDCALTWQEATQRFLMTQDLLKTHV